MLKALVIVGAAAFAALSPDVARAEETPLVNPLNPSEVWGTQITGLGTFGNEVLLIYTNTAATMSWKAPVGAESVRYLVVGGGGGGGGGYGAGGGAGGFFEGEMSVSEGATFDISVGGGGAGGANKTYYASGADGAQSRFDSVVALGGGGGGSYKESGRNGACGGGGSSDSTGRGYGKGTPGQGFDGGYATVGDKGAGGGGGCGGVGGNGNATSSGDGGIGNTSDITGDTLEYAGGGGGFGASDMTAGVGRFGGGNGGAGGVDGAPGATPGAGGGGATLNKVGGRGADGVVILRFVSSSSVTSARLTCSKYAGASTLEDFPLLVRISPSRIAGFSYAGLDPDSPTLTFVCDGRTLDYEVDTWDSEGESLVWVKVPSLTSETVIDFSWGKASSVSARNVWTAYDHVWHFSETSGKSFANAKSDLTAVGNDSLIFSSASAKVGQGVSLPSSKAVTGAIQTEREMSMTKTFTYSGWYKLPGWVKNSEGSYSMIRFGNWDKPQSGFYIELKNSDTLRLITPQKGQLTTSVPLSSFSDYRYVVVRGDGANASLMVDGTAVQASGAITEAFTNMKGTLFGTSGMATEITVSVDECRLSSRALSDDWIAADYRQQATADGLLYEVSGGGRPTPDIPGCTITPEKNVVTASNPTVKLTLGERKADLQIWAAGDTADKGEDIADWRKRVYLGSVKKGAATTVTYTLSEGLCRSRPQAIRIFACPAYDKLLTGLVGAASDQHAGPYVDTGFTPNLATDKIVAQFTPRSLLSWSEAVFTARKSYNDGNRMCTFLITDAATGIRVDYATGTGANVQIAGTGWSAGTRYTVTIDGAGSGSTAALSLTGGTLKKSATPNRISGNAAGSLLVFAARSPENNVPKIDNVGRAAIHSLQVYRSGSLLHDYVPVQTQGENTLYDKVDNVLLSRMNTSGNLAVFGGEGETPATESLSSSAALSVTGEWPYEPPVPDDHWTLAAGMSESADVATTMSDGVWTLSVTIPRGSTAVNVTGAEGCKLDMPGELDLSKPLVHESQNFRVRGLSFDGAKPLAQSGDAFSDYLETLRLPESDLLGIECVRNFANLRSIAPFIPDSVQFVGGDEGVFSGNPSLEGGLSLAGVRCYGVKSTSGKFMLLKGSRVASVAFGSSLPFCPGAKFAPTSAEGFSETAADPAISLPAGFLSGAAELETVVFPKAFDGSVGDLAFDGCAKLSSIGYSGGASPVFDLARCFGGVTSLGGGVFAECRNLRGSLVFSNLGWVTNVERQAYCPALGRATLGRETSIGAQSGIGSVTVIMADCPFALTDGITDYAFHGGTSTKTYGVFWQMESLTNLVVEARQFTKLSGSMCSGCRSLTDVVVASPAIAKVEARAFYNCPSLETVRTSAGLSDYGIDLPTVVEIDALAFGGSSASNLPRARTVRLGSYEQPLAVIGKPTVNGTRVSGVFSGFASLTEVLVSGSDIAFAGGEFCACPSLKTVTIRAKTVTSLGVGGTFSKSTALRNVQWQSAPPPSLSLDVPLFAGVAEKSVVNSVVRTFGWTDASRVNISWDLNGRTGVWRTEPDQLVQSWNPYGGGFVIIGR